MSGTKPVDVDKLIDKTKSDFVDRVRDGEKVEANEDSIAKTVQYSDDAVKTIVGRLDDVKDAKTLEEQQIIYAEAAALARGETGDGTIDRLDTDEKIRKKLDIEDITPDDPEKALGNLSSSRPQETVQEQERPAMGFEELGGDPSVIPGTEEFERLVNREDPDEWALDDEEFDIGGSTISMQGDLNNDTGLDDNDIAQPQIAKPTGFEI